MDEAFSVTVPPVTMRLPGGGACSTTEAGSTDAPGSVSTLPRTIPAAFTSLSGCVELHAHEIGHNEYRLGRGRRHQQVHAGGGRLLCIRRGKLCHHRLRGGILGRQHGDDARLQIMAACVQLGSALALPHKVRDGERLRAKAQRRLHAEAAPHRGTGGRRL